MISDSDELYLDFEAIKHIPIIPLMLEVICKSTGMGFAAVARVTDNRWLACRVRDEINFGLEEGGELKVETTICDEIRDNRKEVVIDHVAASKEFCNHHTPAMYGFQSYISFPIILKNGDFFGTLCAIDPKPATLSDVKTLGTFKLFAELISFHLQSEELLTRSQHALQRTTADLNFSRDINEQYRQISNHNLKEQLRKITMFSNLLMRELELNDNEKAIRNASKVHSLSLELNNMFNDVAYFSSVDDTKMSIEFVSLQEAIDDACKKLLTAIKYAQVAVTHEKLPLIYGDRQQVTQLFVELLQYVIMFIKPGHNPKIKISAQPVEKNTPGLLLTGSAKETDYSEIIIEISQTGIDNYNLNNIFDIFVNTNDSTRTRKYGPGLARSKKIVYNHKGAINAKLISEDVTLLSVVFPVNEQPFSE